jgi:hypothetical protein
MFMKAMPQLRRSRYCKGRKRTALRLPGKLLVYAYASKTMRSVEIHAGMWNLPD